MKVMCSAIVCSHLSTVIWRPKSIFHVLTKILTPKNVPFISDYIKHGPSNLNLAQCFSNKEISS